MKRKLLILMCACMMAAGCGKEASPTSVSEETVWEDSREEREEKEPVSEEKPGGEQESREKEQVGGERESREKEQPGGEQESREKEQPGGEQESREKEQVGGERESREKEQPGGEQESREKEQAGGEQTEEKNQAGIEVVKEGNGENDVTGGNSGKETGGEKVRVQGKYQQAAYFLDQVYAGKCENTLVSPLSLNFALGLTAEGAGGETAKELFRYLGREDYADFAKDYMAFAEGLTAKEKGGFLRPSSGYTFQYTIANSLWVDAKRKLLPDYKKAMQEKYLAEVDSLDFAKEPEKAADKINNWCKKKTNGLIPRILTADALRSITALVLVNSVYFESPWVDEWGLTNHTFTALDGKETTREMLRSTTTVYYENDAASAFAKDYYNGFQFIGILPKTEGDFRVGDLDLEGLLASRTTAYDVIAIAPKLEYDTATMPQQIINILKDQGVELAFDADNADFTNMIEMNPDENAYIGDILQKCKIELDENGTKAAAVTAVVVDCATSCVTEPRQIKEVYLDRPFAFLIYDSRNEEIVFAGKVTTLDGMNH